MDKKVNIYFSNGKDLTVILKGKEFNKFIDDMGRGKPYWNDDKKSGFAVPLYNVLYYTFTEYTEEMKQADADRVKQSQAAVVVKVEETNKEEVKEIKEETSN